MLVCVFRSNSDGLLPAFPAKPGLPGIVYVRPPHTSETSSTKSNTASNRHTSSFLWLEKSAFDITGLFCPASPTGAAPQRF